MSWVIARPGAGIPLVAAMVVMGLLLVVTPLIASTSDVGASIASLVFGLCSLAGASIALLRRSAFVRPNEVRGGLPRRGWIRVTDRQQVLLVDAGRAYDSVVIVRTADGDRRILDCAPTFGLAIGTQHSDQMHPHRRVPPVPRLSKPRREKRAD